MGALLPRPMSFDFDVAVSAPFRMQPGLRRPAAGSPQLAPLQPGSRHQREKLMLSLAFVGDFAVVDGGDRWERFVWNVTDQPRLHVHPTRVDRERWLHNAVAAAIDTPARAAALHAAIASMSAAVLAYHGLTTVRVPLLDWLAARSS